MRTTSAGEASARTGFTTLLGLAQGGDAAAFERIVRLAYTDLRHLARRTVSPDLRRELDRFGVAPTAIVHEALIRIRDRNAPTTSRAHFFALAATILSQIAHDHLRRVRAGRRGGGAVGSLCADPPAPASVNPDATETLLVAMDHLRVAEPRAAEIIVLRLCCDLELTQIATLIDTSLSTVNREWRKAKAWLAEHLQAAGL